MEIPKYLAEAILRHYRTLAEEDPGTRRGFVRLHNARRQAKGEIRRLERLIMNGNDNKRLQERGQGADKMRRGADDG